LELFQKLKKIIADPESFEFIDDEDYEGLAEIIIKKNKTTVAIYCRPGNMRRFITDKDLIDSLRDFISNHT
jgi:hypothetical protein